MQSIYSDRIFYFLGLMEENNYLPIEYIIRVGNDGAVLPITRDNNTDFHWDNILDYMSRIPDLDIETLTDISEKTGIINTELIRAYIAVDIDGFVTKTHARKLLDIIDPQAGMNTDILERKVEPWIEDYIQVAKVEYKTYSKYPIMMNYMEYLKIWEALSESHIVSENLTYPFESPITPIEIFDHCNPSVIIPYISINNNGDLFYKLYNNPGMGLTREYYDNIIDRTRKLDVKGTIMALVWRKGEDFKNPTKDSLIQVFINNNVVRIRFDSKGDITDIIDEIQRTFSIVLPTKIFGSSNFSYKIHDAKYNKYSFQIQLITNPVLNNFIIMNESNTAGSSKRSQMYQFINMGISLPIRGDTPSMSIKQEGSDIMVTLSDVKDRELDYYKELSSKLIAISILDSKGIMGMFGDFSWLSTVKKVGELKTTIGTGPLSDLKRSADDIFISMYSRKCQGKDQPTPIRDEDIDDFKRNTFVFKGKVWNRQVMPFPDDNPRVNLVCLRNPKKPFPGLQVNKLSNNDNVPYNPCCYGTNNFNFVTQTFKKKNPNKMSKNDLVTNKILRMGKMGTLPYRISELLSSIIPGSFKRLGTIINPKSIIHSFLYAIDDQYRIAILDDNKSIIDAKEKQYVNHFNAVLDKLGTGIVRQEMYDYTDEQIRSYINGDHYDYEFIYRMFEEFIGDGYNLFVFANSLTKNTSTGLPGDLIIPRFKLYHYRLNRPERPSIILFKTWGAEGDNADYPQYELVVYEHEDGIQTMFGPDVTEELMNYMTKVHDVKVLDLKMTLPNVNYERYFVEHGFTILSQFIDTYGKLRAIRLEKDSKRIDVLTIPTQPMKYPRFYDISKLPYNVAFGLFGKPYKVNGSNIWYNIGRFNNAFTIPTSTNSIEHVYEEVEGMDLSPLIEEDIRSGNLGSTDRLVKLSKISLILLQIIEWLYNRYDTNFIGVNYDVDELDDRINSFMNEVIWYTEEPVDTLYVYDIQALPYQLPIDDISIDEAITILQKYMPKAIHEGRLLIYGPELRSDIEYFLSRYLRYARQVQRDNNGKITSRYMTIYDFIPKQNSIVFNDMSDIESWIKKITNEESKISINDRLVVWNGSSEDPEILNIDGDLYIIQNVSDNTVHNCYTLELEWRKSGINLGFIRNPTDITNVKIELYHLEPDTKIKHLGVIQDGTLDTIKVLEFSRGRFAAMLKI